MHYEDHAHDFEDRMPMDLTSFFYPEPDEEALQQLPSYMDYYPTFATGGSASGLPNFPTFSAAAAGTGPAGLPRLPTRGNDETFGGEIQIAGFGNVQPIPNEYSIDECTERVTPYLGTDEEGICHAIISIAGYTGLMSPLNLRRYISEAIAMGPVPPDKRLPPLEHYGEGATFASAYLRLSMSAYSGPSALLLKLPGRCLVLLACGDEVVLVDPRDQPAKPSPTGLPRLIGDGALVKMCHDNLEMSAFINGAYQTSPASADLFQLKDPQAQATKEVTHSVETLTLEQDSLAVVAAMDAALKAATEGDAGDAGNKAWMTQEKAQQLKKFFNDDNPNQGIREDPIIVPGEPLAPLKRTAPALKDLYKSDSEHVLREMDGMVPRGVSDVAVAAAEDKNKEGKRERTPPTPPAAMGSPVRMESDDEGREQPKRAKTPPLAPVSTPVTSAASPLPAPAVVKAERRKSAPKAARTSGSTTVAPVPPPSASGKKIVALTETK